MRLGQRRQEVAEFGVEREGDGLGVGIDAHDRDLSAKCPDPMSRMPIRSLSPSGAAGAGIVAGRCRVV
ncbi:MAG: hypothetical protein ACOVOI_00750, partial [Hyphomicrobiales bacterium]